MEKPKTIRIRDKRPTLKEAQKMVGGLIEIIYDDGETQIIGNEEGKVLGQPFNKEATEYWTKKIADIPYDILNGDVLILKGKARLD